VPVQVSYYTSFTLSHSTYPEAVKTLKIYITVSNISPKYDMILMIHIMKELLATFSASNVVKLRLKTAPSLAISHTGWLEIAPRLMYQPWLT